MERRWGGAFVAFSVILWLAVVKGADGVQITALRVPVAVRNGSSSVLLDCEYSLRTEELRTEEAGLVVKWYFNNGPSPVYQWIPGGRPQDLGILRGRLDLRHRATDHEATMHRALYIVRPTTELSGEYKCHVSTFKDEDFMTKTMVVFAPGEDLEMWGSPQGDQLNVSCRGKGFFPEPELSLYINDKKVEDAALASTLHGDAYDVATSTLLPPQNDAEETSTVGTEAGPALVACHLKIPGTEFALRKSFVYYKGKLTRGEDVSE